MPPRHTRRIWSREPTTRRKYCMDIPAITYEDKSSQDHLYGVVKRQTGLPDVRFNLQTPALIRRAGLLTNNSNKIEPVPVFIYPCHTGSNQKFQYNRKTRQIRSVSSNKCIDISPDNRIVQGTCNSRKKTQKWKRSKGRWRSVYNKKCIDVEGGQYVNGRLISWKCHSGPNQKFSK